MKKFDNFYDEKLRLGTYHWTVLITMTILTISMGGYIVLFPFALRFLQEEFFLTFQQTSIFSISSTCGGIVSGFFFGKCLQKFGRRRVLIVGMFISSVLGCAFHFLTNFYLILGIFFVLSVTIHFSLASSVIYLGEVFPARLRATAIITSQMGLSIGKILASGLLFLDASKYEVGIWKLPYIQISLISILGFVSLVFILKESVRFSYYKGHFKTAHKNFQWMQKVNSRESLLERDGMLHSYESFVGIGSTEDSAGHVSSPFATAVLKAKSKFKILVFFLCWMGNFGIVFGAAMAVPNILGTENSVLFLNFLIGLGEIMGSFLVMALVDRPWMGRKRLIHIAAGFNFVLCAMAIFNQKMRFLGFVFFALKIGIKACWSTILVHMTESFTVANRDICIAKVEFYAGIVGLVSGPIFFKVLSINNVLVFVLLSSYAFIVFFASFLLPQDAKKNLPEAQPEDDQIDSHTENK